MLSLKRGFTVHAFMKKQEKDYVDTTPLIWSYDFIQKVPEMVGLCSFDMVL